jgi:acyl-CoA reductase-like NAD-dependent aldehyde dehydrogenase
MSGSTKIISPIDSSVYAERPLTTDGALEAAVSRARAAQAEWARVPIAERAKGCFAMLDALVAMNDEIVPSSPGRWGGRCVMAARSAASRSVCAT